MGRTSIVTRPSPLLSRPPSAVTSDNAAISLSGPQAMPAKRAGSWIGSASGSADGYAITSAITIGE